MTDPISFSTSTARLGMPMLFAGQSQKENTVNEALAVLDILVPASVQGIRNEPPANPSVGDTWIVGANPTGAFADRANALVGWTEGGWRFSEPVLGMRVFDLQDEAFRLYEGAWVIVSAPAAPVGGAVIDVEARAAIGALIQKLKETGAFSGS